MPQCYLIALSAGSSLDQQSNNITLFNLVEQVNVPPGAQPPAGNRVPLEIHAYLRMGPAEVGQEFQMRFVLVSQTGLETYADPVTHRAATARLRTRSLGVPFPPILGHYDLRIDFRSGEHDSWTRDAASWPIAFLQAESKPKVTH
jgi:hypothetical protein